MQNQTEEHRWFGVTDALAVLAYFLISQERWKAWTVVLVLGSVVGAVLTNETWRCIAL